MKVKNNGIEAGWVAQARHNCQLSLLFIQNYSAFYLFLIPLSIGFAKPETGKVDSQPGLSQFFVVDAGEDQIICKGDTVQLTASGALSYEWSPASSLSCTNCTSPFAFPQSTTTYFVLGNDGSRDSVKVTVSEPPVFTPVNNVHPTDCGRNDGSITVNVVGSNPLEYSIDGGKTWSANKVFNGLNEGDYDIAVRYQNGKCNTPYPFNPVVLRSTQSFVIQNLAVTHPGGCNANDGSISITTSAAGDFRYSVDGGLNYQSGKTFNGLGAGTYQIRVTLVGSTCSATAVISLFIQKGCPDTVNVVIPPGVMTTYCLDTSVFEIKGKISGASICNTGSPLTVSTGNIDSTCLTLIPATGFKGTSPNLICVIHCFNNNLGSCDTTYLRVSVSDNNCNNLFSQDSISFSFEGNPTPVCIPLAPIKASQYSLLLNGSPLGNLQGCSFDSVIVYSYAFIPGAGANGPYILNSWIVNGLTYDGFFTNISDLVGLMNTFDPNGKWQLETSTGIIFGGNFKNTYGNIRLTHFPTGSSVVMMTNLSILPAGFIVNLSSPALHTLVAIDPITGCSDTLYINLPVRKTTTDKVNLASKVNTPSSKHCVSSAELPGRVFGKVSIYTPPKKGTLSLPGDTCVVFTPTGGFTGLDTFALVACSNTSPQICDTTLFFVRVLPQTDTIRLTILPGAGKVDTCLANNIIDIIEPIVNSGFCGINSSEAAGTINGKCLSFSPVSGFYGITQVCLVLCNASICDTTIVIIEILKPIGCTPYLSRKEINMAVQNGLGTICVPFPFSKTGDYNLLLNGTPYSKPIIPCDKDLVKRYSWGAVFGQGTQGPYAINWEAKGGTFIATVVNMNELLLRLNAWDPAGRWTISTDEFTLISSNEDGEYGRLQIRHIASGNTSNLLPDLIEIANGSELSVNSSGRHQVIFVHKTSGCRDTMILNALEGVKVLNLKTVENVPTRIECLDITKLPGNFTSIGICKQPRSGMIITNNNCFTYNPLGGFIGNDDACVVACDDKGNCDTTLLYITVRPLCSLYDLFPDALQTFEVSSCDDFISYCVPVRMDSLVKYAITDNGSPYTAGFTYCNGNQAQMKLDTGLHKIVFRHLGSNCIDELHVEVKCKTKIINCGIKAVSASPVMAGDCGSKAVFCVQLPFADRGKYLITDNGKAVNSGVVACGQNNLLTGIPLDTGAHTLIFKDTVIGCSDTLLVKVVCPKLIFIDTDRSFTIGDSLRVCLADLGFDVALIDSVVSICPPPHTVNANFSLNKATWCLSAKGLVPGRDTVCYRVYGRGIGGTITLRVNVNPPCPDWLVLDTMTIVSSTCSGGFGQICIPVSPAEIKGKDLRINGILYTGPLSPCKFDSVYILNYSELPGKGLLGPYLLDRWTINGIVFSGEFSSAETLAALMRTWDPGGNWAVLPDPSGQTTLIRGGKAQNIYGFLIITQKNTGIRTQLGINAVFMPISVSINLTPGIHRLKIADTATGCSDSTIVKLACITTSTFRDSIAGGKSKTYCLDLSDLPGQVLGIKEVCGAAQAGLLSLNIQNNCITITGIKAGVQTACIVACDNLGFCDTTKLVITVTSSVDQIPKLLSDTINGNQGGTFTANVLSNDIFQSLTSLNIQKRPLNGSAILLPDGTLNYFPDQGYCSTGPDSLTYVACTAAGCSTASVFFFVQCPTLEVYNAFSPNGDGINDFFTIAGIQKFPGNRLQIFNRWGNIVFDGSNYKNTWDGTWEGKDLPDGTYIYRLYLGDDSKPKSGYVHLRR